MLGGICMRRRWCLGDVSWRGTRRPQFDGKGWQCAGGRLRGVGSNQTINSVAAARSGCNNTAGLQGVLYCTGAQESLMLLPIWQLRSSHHSATLSCSSLALLAPSKTQIFHASISSSLHRQHNKHYLTAALSLSMVRAVFALRVEEIRHIAGHPTWINSF
jgi:hypothetical protein